MTWSQESRGHLLWVTPPIVEIEAFRWWRDGSATKGRAVEGEGFAQRLQLGVGSHGGFDFTPLKAACVKLAKALLALLLVNETNESQGNVTLTSKRRSR